MRDPLIDLLKIEVCNCFGRNINSSSDCMALSDSIFAKTYFYLSPNTLRRFFGLVKTNFKQSSSTLRILSAYCGFRDFTDFKEKNARPEHDHPDTSKNLLNDYLLTAIPELKFRDRSFREVIKHTFNLLTDQPEQRTQYLKEIVATRNGRLFFEKFIDIDNLNYYYGEGINYYLSDNKDHYEICFGNFVLALKYWLLNDDLNLANAVSILEVIKSTESSEISSKLYLYARLLLENQLHLDQSHSMDEIRTMHACNFANMNYESVSDFNLKTIVFLILILTENYKEALACTSAAINYNGIIPELDTYIQSINLYHAIALFNLGEKQNAIDLFHRINTADFYFLVKNINMILYKNLENAILSKSSYPHLDVFVNKTGFKRLIQVNPPLYTTY